jgi:1-acyl-sn-glycerol-3-phosphate acyltransferase
MKIPVLSWFLRHLNSIPIRRSSADRKGIMLCRNVLKSGDFLLIFPEGTRSRDGRIGPMKLGAAMVIGALPDIPVVPVYIDGTFQALPQGRWFPRPKRVTIRFGPAFKIPQKGVEMDKKSYYISISDLFCDKIKSLRK